MMETAIFVLSLLLIPAGLLAAVVVSMCLTTMLDKRRSWLDRRSL